MAESFAQSQGSIGTSEPAEPRGENLVSGIHWSKCASTIGLSRQAGATDLDLSAGFAG